MTPYYADEMVTLYHGDCREVLSALGLEADCVLADPPYGETSLRWDHWPGEWLNAVAGVTRSLWCFGSLRMFLEHAEEFAETRWKLSQDVIWEKHTGSGFHADRFKRVHESAVHWYRGDWGSVYHEAPKVAYNGPRRDAPIRRGPTEHMGSIGQQGYVSGSVRLQTSVLRVRSMHGRAIHPTEKPLGILSPLIAYACPAGGIVIDPFAGSGSTLDAARQLGCRAVGVEADERYCERAARRLAQGVLEAR